MIKKLKNQKNNIYYWSKVLFIIFIISFLIEVLFFNFKPIIYGNKIIDITNNTLITTDKITIKTKDKINKLVINYQTNETIKVNVKIKNNENILAKYEDEFTPERNRMVINIGEKINTITLTNDINKLTMNSVQIDNTIHINLYRLLFVFSVLLLIFIVYYFKKNDLFKDKLHILYFLISVILGSMIIILQPASNYISWDDQDHFANSYNMFEKDVKWYDNSTLLREGEAFSYNNVDSVEEKEDYASNLNNKTNYNHSEEGRINYSKIGYLILGIILFFGRLLKLPFLFTFSLAKIINLFVYSLGFSFAIKKAKIGKKLLFLIGLMPTTIFLSAQYSYDPYVTLGFTLAAVYLINIFVDKNEKIDFKWMLIFLLAILLASCIKGVYILLILLFLFIPKDRFVSQKQSIKMKTCIFIICLAVLSTFLLPAASGSLSGDARGGDTSVNGQIAYILSHPNAFINIFKTNVIDQFFIKFFDTQTIGHFAYLGTISANFTYIYLFAFAYLLFTESNKYELKTKYKTLMFIVLCMIITLIWIALYLSYTPVGSQIIQGVQGRYFIPLMYLLFMCFSKNKKQNKEEKYENVIIAMIPIIINVITIYSLILIPYSF